MKLECAQSISSPDASVEEIETAFADDHGRGEFVILTKDDGSFIQATGEFDGPYVLGYCDSQIDKQFSAVGEFTKDQVRSAFLSYLAGDSNWYDTNTWKKFENKGCLHSLGITVLGVAIITISVLAVRS